MFKGIRPNPTVIEYPRSPSAPFQAQPLPLSPFIDALSDAIIIFDEEQRVITINPAAEELLQIPVHEVVGLPVARFLPERSTSLDSGRPNADAPITHLAIDGKIYFCAVLRAPSPAIEPPAPSPALTKASHEIRTPLNAILGLTQLLLDTSLTTDQMELCESIRLSGETLLSLVNDLLDLSRLDANGTRLESEPFHLLECIEEALSLVAPQAAQKGLDLGCFLDPTIPPVLQGDRARVRQVLINLLGNAVKFTPRGTVQLWVAPAHAQSGVEFSVRDTGVGIPPARVNELFQPFHRLHSELATPGSGLGLAFCKSWVESMGGSISAHSTPGQGSTFRFWLPLKPVESETPAEPRRLPSQHLLLVEDNPLLSNLLTAQLRAWGLAVRSVESLPAALEALEEQPVDLMLVDSRQTTQEEMARLQSLSAHKALMGRPVVLLVPFGKTGELRRQYANLRLLSRPVRPSALHLTLAQAIAGDPIDLPVPVSGGVEAPVQPKNLRILVAEDEPVNHKITTMLLTSLGYRPKSAATGREVLERLRHEDFDVVLMDVEMPELDGIETTRAIRRDLPAERQPRIIAMTAHASQPERQRCLDAGMDDFMTKPLRKDRLQAALDRQPERKPRKAHRSTTPAHINRSRLREYFRVDGRDWQSMLGEVIDIYLSSLPQWLHALEQGCRSENWSEVRRIAHSLKSTSAHLSADRLAALAAQIERATSSLDGDASLPPQALAPQMAAVQQESLAVRKSLLAFRKEL